MTTNEQAAPAGVALALKVSGVSKIFGEAKVLDSVDFDLRWGEVHALLGENGAGKSTLMNILTGIYAADTGQIGVDGASAAIRAPSDAMALGIGMVHQHFKLILSFTARENLRLAAGSTGGDWIEIDVRIAEVLERTGLEVSLDTPVATLSVAERQRIEILKVLILGARILILDEPTAVLTDHEAERLLALMRDLASSSHAIIFITHKLREVMNVGDRVSTLRQGQMVMQGQAVAGVTSADLSAAMIGGEQMTAEVRTYHPSTTQILQIKDLSVWSGGVQSVVDANLMLHAGEILGLAGVGGNGQRELAESLMGLTPATGQITLHGDSIERTTVAERRSLGLRYIPADRASDGLSPNNPVADNLSATAVRTGALGQPLVGPRRILEHARDLIDMFQISGATNEGRRPIRLLSGGNAQKSVLARELDKDAKLIIAHSPTRGLDVAACRFVHDQLTEATKRGCGVLLISEDLEEILALSDHIHVISRGRLATTPGARPAREDIGELMLGHA